MSTSARIFLCFPDQIFRNGLGFVKVSQWCEYRIPGLGVAVTLANALERQDARLLDLWDKAAR